MQFEQLNILWNNTENCYRSLEATIKLFKQTMQGHGFAMQLHSVWHTKNIQNLYEHSFSVVTN